jgi:hypothetical protein
MTTQIFWWWVFPILVGVGGLCWIWYQKRYHPER